MVVFQYFSDIHLEFYYEKFHKMISLFSIDPNKHLPDVLLLPGDIGNPYLKSYSEYLKHISPNVSQIFLTTGNHEYYSKSNIIAETDHLCREICRNMPHDNVHFLQNDVHHIKNNLSIFGGTMWTYMPPRIDTSSITDFDRIPYFTVKERNDLFKTCVQTLTSTLAESPPDTNWVVMTHHMPSFELIAPKYREYKDFNYAFAANVDEIASDPRIAAWVYGHTHYASVNGKFYCNPIGYPGENRTWTLNKFFEVP